MAEYSSGEVAQMLGIAPMTLRRWCLELSPWLTPSAAGAAPPGEAREACYTEDDLWVLQHAAPLLRESRDYAQIRAWLAGVFPLDPAQERAVGVDQAGESAAPPGR